jgi:transcriptional regulator with XRE-family HTH domain
MNEKIVQTVKAKMEADGISQGELSRRLGMQRSNLARLVNRRAGDIPRRWQEILDELGLELIAVPKEDELG